MPVLNYTFPISIQKGVWKLRSWCMSNKLGFRLVYIHLFLAPKKKDAGSSISYIMYHPSISLFQYHTRHCCLVHSSTLTTLTTAASLDDYSFYHTNIHIHIHSLIQLHRFIRKIKCLITVILNSLDRTLNVSLLLVFCSTVFNILC